MKDDVVLLAAKNRLLTFLSDFEQAYLELSFWINFSTESVR